MPRTDPIRQPVIIEAAINGQTQKDANPQVPHSSQEIASDALRCRHWPLRNRNRHSEGETVATSHWGLGGARRGLGGVEPRRD